MGSIYRKGILDSFPYHGLMLCLLAPFSFLGELFGLGKFFIKIPSDDTSNEVYRVFKEDIYRLICFFVFFRSVYYNVT